MKFFYFILVIFSWLINPMTNFSQEGFNKALSFNGTTAVFLDVFALNNHIYVSAIITDTTGGIIQDVHALYKTDFNGNPIDTIFLKLPYHYILRKKNIVLTPDSSVIATGNIYTPGEYTIIIYKYKADSVQWIKQITDQHTSMPFFSTNVLSSEDSSIYLLVNYQENSYDVNTMVIKLRSNGEEIWRRKYGGGSHSEIPQCMTWMPDGSILIGSSKSNFAHVPILTPELYPTWLFRIDTAGQLLNQWTNPDPMSWFPGALAPTPDGGIVFAGAYTEYHSNGYAVTKNYVRKLQSNYVLEWELILGNSAGVRNFLEDLNIYDNKIFIVGIEYDSTFKKASEISLPYQNYYGVLYCFDLNGNTIYKRYFHVPSPVRDIPGVYEPTPIIYSINIPNDSTLLMAGELRVSFSPPQPTLPTQYGWLIKTNLQGCIAPDDCDYIGIEEQPNKPLLRCWPNPATEQLSLQVDEPWLHSRFTILNLQGQTLQRGLLVAPLTIFDVQHWPPGLYIIHLQKNGKQTHVKWIKQ